MSEVEKNEEIVGEVVALLDAYADLELEITRLEAARNEELMELLGPPLYAQFVALSESNTLAVTVTKSKMDRLKTRIQELVLELGTTVKGMVKQAVYTKPRVSWDSKLLDGYAAAHPEVLPFKSVGSASVAVRNVSK